jgi:hypothetical protein
MPMPRVPPYIKGEKPARRGRLVCPECESKADIDGYCTEPGCRNEGKSVAGALPIFQDRRGS